jgi:hypothetical protein
MAGRPQNNGLVEFIDSKSHDRGFFCMKLAGYIMSENKEKEERELKERGFAQTDIDSLWQLRFSEAKKGRCAYRDRCPVHARTIAKKEKRPIQLQIF